MNGDRHLQAIAGSNQGLQDFSSTLKAQARYFPVLEQSREYWSAFFYVFFLKQLSKNDWFWNMYFTMTSSGTVHVGSSSLCLGQFSYKRQVRKHTTPHSHMLFPDPSLQGWVASCLLLPLSYSSACQTFNSMKAPRICKGRVGSHVLQCLDLFPSFPIQ